MAMTTKSFTYAGGAQTFVLSLGLDYAAESDISVYVVGELDGEGDQIYRAFTFDSEFVIRVTADLDVDDVVVVERTVSQTVRKVDFNTGGDVTPANLQLQYEHIFSLQQELLDGRVGLLNPAVDAAAAALSAAAAAVSAAEAANSIGDMLKATYDPQSIIADAFDTDQHTDGSTNKVYTSTDKDKLAAIETAADVTDNTNVLAAVPEQADSVWETGTDTTPGVVAPDAIAAAIAALVVDSGIFDQQTFNSSDTWTKPTAPAPAANAMALIETWAGGGSGRNGGQGGGGGGGHDSGWVLVSTLGATETVTVGAGGAAQETNSTNGNAGGDTTFGNASEGIRIGAQGGAGGLSAAGAVGGAGASPDGPTMTDIYRVGGAQAVDGYLGGGGGGRTGVGADSQYGGAGGGGSSDRAGGVSKHGGNGGAGVATGAGVAGTAPAGGGGASGDNSNSGAGGDGRVRVTIFS